MMRTNFAHLSGYPKFYEAAISAEKMVLRSKTQTEMKMAGNAIRQVAEGLLKECVKKYRGCCEKSNYRNYKMAKNANILSRNSLRNFNTLRDYGNQSSHPDDTITRQQLIMMYELLYEESYKMVHYYLKEETVKAYKAERNHFRSASRSAYGIAGSSGRGYAGSSSAIPAKPSASIPAKPASVSKKKRSIFDTLLSAVIWILVIIMVLSVLSTV